MTLHARHRDQSAAAIIDRIVRWLALSRIHPNVLTFLGLVINIVAALAVRARQVHARPAWW